nr:DUF362 domain-containing protein [Candidatus Njordarchaeota archaeon]
MVSKVAIVRIEDNAQTSFQRSIKLIGGIGDLNTSSRPVVIKPGVFEHRKKNHTTVEVMKAIVSGFNLAPRILVAESDNYKGTGLERLQIWKQIYNERVQPFSLSEDKKTRQLTINNEKINFSEAIFKPNVFVSTHVLRRFEQGTILKNLLGLVPDRKKVRFHKVLPNALLDMYEAIGGIDLAVIDGTFAYLEGVTKDNGKRIDILIVGRDSVAVEAVGAEIVGMRTDKIPVLLEAARRGLGEADLNNIELLGESVEELKEKVESIRKTAKRKTVSKKKVK